MSAERSSSPWRIAFAVGASGCALAALLWAWLRQSHDGFLARTSLDGVANVVAVAVLVFTAGAVGVAWALARWNARQVTRRVQALSALEAELRELEARHAQALRAAAEERLQLDHRRDDLQLREEKWRVLQAQVAISVTDPQGLILEVNTRFCELSGYSREELVGASHAVVSTGQQPRAFWSSFWADLKAGRVWRGVMHNRTKTGELYWTETRVAPVFDANGSVSRFVAVAFDVTNYQRRQRELSLERDQLATIVEGMRAGTWEWRYQAGGMRVNRRFLALLGLPSMAELTWVGLRERMHPEDQERVQTALASHLTGQSVMFDLELRFRGAGSDWLWCQMRGAVVQRTPNGEPLVLAGTLISIDERRQAQERARIQRLISDRAQRLAQVGGFELRWSGHQLTWTDQCFHLHDLVPGVQPTWAQALGYVHPEDRTRFEAAIEQAVRDVQGWDVEVRLVTALGREIWVRVVGEAEYDDNGPVRAVGVFQDVGAQKALEEGVMQQQALLHAVVENLPLGLSVFGPDMKLIAHNQALLPLLELPADLLVEGRTRYEDVLQFNLARGEYGQGEVAEQTVARLSRMASDPVTHQFERTRPNGVTLDVRGAPMPGGGMVTTYIDISERKRAEEAVHAQERFLRLVADAVPGRIAYWTRAGRCVFANRAYATWLDTTPESLIGSMADESMGGSWVREQVKRLQPLFIDGQALRFDYEDGNGATLLVHCEPDFAEDEPGEVKTVRGVIVMALDVSELKAVQRQTEQLNALLSVERDRANAASVAKSQFLATISHEIRTPMNAVMGMLRLLRKTALLGQQLDYVSKAEAAAKSLLALLNDVLDFSKVEADKVELEVRPFVLDEVLRELAVIMAAGAEAKPIELVFDLDPALPARVVGDQLRLRQVLINLVGNAVKFTAAGTVRLQVRALGSPGSHARIGFAVHDTGIGIAPEKLGHIFEGFSQAEASTTRRFGGTGLGLAISQRLVRLMGADLSVHSELGKGSVFSFDLELAVEHTPPPDPLPTLCVLLVEPHEGSRAAISALMEATGVRVRALADGVEARRLIDSDPAIDLVWIATQLPGEDGWDCGQALRQRRAAMGRPVRWLLAGNAQQREHLSGRAQGPDAFVVKPLCASLLRDALGPGKAPVPAPAARGQGLAGMRLLVAEDNPNNQQVAQELLEHEGARVVLADDGAQALALLREQRFDVVLMDMQMPVMDGLAATRAIRDDLGLTRLPIVAMTANAGAGDRDACLAAGMNAHVGKPFELDALVALLRRLAGREALAPVAAPVPALPTRAVPAAQQQRAAARGLDLQAGMDRFLGRTELYLRTARSFAAQAQGLPAQLRGWMAATPPDVLSAQQALHSFKGLAATLACEGLAHWGKVGEQRTRAGHPLEPEWLASFEAQVAEGLALLLQEAQALHEPPTATEAPPDARPAPLMRLRQLVDSRDPTAAHFLSGQRAQIEPWLGTGLTRLEAALAVGDFDSAQAIWSEAQPAGTPSSA